VGSEGITPAERREIKEGLLQFVKNVSGSAEGGRSKYPEEVKVLPDIVEILLTRF
jgi:hypothetical protein